MAAPVDVERLVQRRFAPAERVEALDLLAKAVIHDGQPAEPLLSKESTCTGTESWFESEA